MLALTRTMLDAQDDEFICRGVDCVVDQIPVFGRHELSDSCSCLTAAYFGKQQKSAQAVINRGPDGLCCRGIALTKVVGNLDNVLDSAGREAKLHPKR